MCASAMPGCMTEEADGGVPDRCACCSQERGGRMIIGSLWAPAQESGLWKQIEDAEDKLRLTRRADWAGPCNAAPTFFGLCTTVTKLRLCGVWGSDLDSLTDEGAAAVADALSTGKKGAWSRMVASRMIPAASYKGNLSY